MPAQNLDPAFSQSFAQEWLAAWNAHDLDRILDHYDDEVILTSPVAQKLLNNDGAVHGKAALRDYFARGLTAYPHLQFELIDVLSGLETIVLYYRNNVRGNKTAEVMLLTPAGKVSRIWANYDQ